MSEGNTPQTFEQKWDSAIARVRLLLDGEDMVCDEVGDEGGVFSLRYDPSSLPLDAWVLARQGHEDGIDVIRAYRFSEFPGEMDVYTFFPEDVDKEEFTDDDEKAVIADMGWQDEFDMPEPNDKDYRAFFGAVAEIYGDEI